MSLLAALLRRDLGLLFGGGRGGPWLPVLFFIAVAVLSIARPPSRVPEVSDGGNPFAPMLARFRGVLRLN